MDKSVRQLYSDILGWNIKYFRYNGLIHWWNYGYLERSAHNDDCFEKYFIVGADNVKDT